MFQQPVHPAVALYGDYPKLVNVNAVTSTPRMIKRDCAQLVSNRTLSQALDGQVMLCQSLECLIAYPLRRASG